MERFLGILIFHSLFAFTSAFCLSSLRVRPLWAAARWQKSVSRSSHSTFFEKCARTLLTTSNHLFWHLLNGLDLFFGHFWRPKKVLKNRYLGPFFPRDIYRPPLDPQCASKDPQEAPKMAYREAKEAPRDPHGTLNVLLRLPKGPQNGSQGGSRDGQERTFSSLRSLRVYFGVS